MIAVRLLLLALRQALGTPWRSALTVIAVASGVALITGVLALDRALGRALAGGPGGEELLVLQAHRYCPQASWLPEHLLPSIAAVPGVAAVRPLRILPSHCGTSLDVLVLRGVPPDNPGPGLIALSGSLETWPLRPDGALVGRAVAQRRQLAVGDAIEVAGVRALVHAIIDGPHPADREQVRVHLNLIQRQQAGRDSGLVTGFQVSVAPGHEATAVATAIDAASRSLGLATGTRPESQAMQAAARDLISIAGATRLLAAAAALAVAALVGNALILGLRARQRSLAVLAAVGYPGRIRALLVLAEGLVLAIGGGLLGVGASAVWLSLAPPGIASEGWSLSLRPDASLPLAFALSLVLGLVAAAVPAWRAARLDLPSLLRAGAAA